MRIRTFAELNPSQHEELYRYILAVRENPQFFSSPEEMMDDFSSLTFRYGEHLLIAVEGNRICGTLGVITKEAAERREIFLTAVNVRPEDGMAFHLLLNRAFELTRGIPGITYKLGFPPEMGCLMEIAQAGGFRLAYRNLRMKLVDGEPLSGLILPADLTFQSLNRANARDFYEVHNAAFRISPNGVILTPEEMEETLARADGVSTIEQIGYTGTEPVLVLSLSRQKGEGWIEGLGVHPARHGRGFGKWALCHSAGLLRSLGCRDILLTVIETNANAYQLYRKYGFQPERVNSIWLEK